MFVVVTALCCVLGYQGRWIYARREAIRSGIAVRHIFATNRPVPQAPFALWVLGISGEEHLFVAPAHFERICELFPEAEVLEYGGMRRTRPWTIGNSKQINQLGPTRTDVFPIPKE
jgi:hypothetical protein